MDVAQIHHQLNSSLEKRPASAPSREHEILEQVLFIGGLPGCGKTLFSPILTTFDRMESQKFNFMYEHISLLRFLNHMDAPSATLLLRLCADNDIYNLMMSREVNFRPTDLSSMLKNPKTSMYLKRLVSRGDALAYERIKKEKPILHITVHNLLPQLPALLTAFQKRIQFIEVLRHPLYMIKQWFLYIDRYGTDPRDLTVWLKYKNLSLPWFAHGWEEQYSSMNSMDKVIHSIDKLTQWGELVLNSLSEEERKQVVVIPFERFVKNPYPYLSEIETLLKSKMTPLTVKELKKQKVPREKIADGVAYKIYKEYGWKPSAKGSSEQDELIERMKFAKEKASAGGIALLEKMCARYEERFPIL